MQNELNTELVPMQMGGSSMKYEESYLNEQ